MFATIVQAHDFLTTQLVQTVPQTTQLCTGNDCYAPSNCEWYKYNNWIYAKKPTHEDFDHKQFIDTVSA
eukprot:CAMPEP_0181309448 /NCGR_PEP_ID=MMETSP1101-20121128/12017_1 /TAXON_ID=46948 /ORGANISM="Rhodomonas abbreviata, Strain Caron Lab Isolate" /LENGTH=68 /DNA_ID=CAMNT_0023415929 /DNA_START=24 /DNA_END=230 /DNA_ORIENTATION=+